MNSLFKKIRLRSLIFVLAILYLSISLISAQFELMTKKQEYENTVNQRERLGYANPGETVYVDVQSE